MKLDWKSWAIGLAVAGVMAGCGSGGGSTEPTDGTAKPAEGSTAQGEAPKALKITLIAKSNDNPVFQAARMGAEAAAKEQGEKHKMTITIDWRTPDKEDGEVQAQRIGQAVAEGTNAIILSSSDAAKVTGAINDAVDKGVPVFCFDSDVPDSKRFGFYGADDIKAGKEVIDQLAKVTGSTGNVAILAGNQNAPNLQKRVQGVKDGLASYPNMKLVDVFYHNESPQDAAAEVQSAMKANPDINAWAMVGGWPLFTKTLLNDIDPAKVKIVAVDCLPAQMAYIDKGICPVLLAQPVFDWGKISVEKVVEKIVDKKDVPVVTEMSLIPVDKAGLKDWANKLKGWGFTDVDPKYLQ
ncbi:MAG: substrate-binding domain-containing protein [Armatimonadetes bacterium]|nr:substrate-binding domain-containing protein [Armatimonadota bacterium]